MSSNRSNKILGLTTAVALVLVVVLAGLTFNARAHAPASATSTPSPSQSAASVAKSCTTKDLSATINADGGGAAGTVYQQLILTNHGTSACTVVGFPGLSLVDASGAQLGSPAARGGSVGSVVTLDPDHSAVSAVGFPAVGNFSPGTCSAPSTNLKVFPPGQTASLTVALKAQYCPGFSVLTLVAQ